MRKIRIGSGAGYADDVLFPAIELLEKTELDYMCFECMAERTTAIAQLQKLQNPEKGYNYRLEERFREVLPLAYEKKVKIITNMGAANVPAAVEKTIEIAKDLNLTGLKVAGVLGDDFNDTIENYMEAPLFETGESLSVLKGKIVSANVYLGTDGIVEALKNEADVIITGRCADSALFLAPITYEFGWDTDELKGKGICVGHLMECGGYITGGYFAGVGLSKVENLWNTSNPIAEVYEDGTFYIEKLPDSGGRLDRHTCIEQLLYEIHNPAEYITPDVVADFSKVFFEEETDSRVKVTGAAGRPATDTYKASIGYRDGYIGIDEFSLGGYAAVERAELAIDNTKKLWNKLGIEPKEAKFDIIGYNSQVTGPEIPTPDKDTLTEVRVRVAVRTDDAKKAKLLLDCVNSGLLIHVGGNAQPTLTVKEVIAIASILVPKKDIDVKVIYREVV